MNIANIEIRRAITHEVVRASHLTERPPVLSDELVVLDEPGKKLVARRLVDTVASGSHCVDVDVEDSTVGSPFDKATGMLDLDDDGFVANSRNLATSLSTAQTAGSIRAGSAIFIQGTCVVDGESARFLAVIKADSDQGLVKQVRGDNITLSFVSDMLLGESQRLVKIAFFIEDAAPEAPTRLRAVDDFSIKVFDHLMQNSGEGEAAAYFYRTFLKCKPSHNAARKTKQFFEVVKSFVDQVATTQEERVELHGDLISYMRLNNSILEPRTFAQEVLPQEQQDSFLRKCQEAGLAEAFTKDTSLVKGKLRRQSVKFSSNVTLYAPSDVFRDSVQIIGTSDDGWTELRIRGLVESS